MTHRRIRSYVRREGRITPAQQRALNELWPIYGIGPGGEAIDPVKLFGRDVPTIMEVGFGNGDTLIELAAQQPECNFIGVDVYRPGVGRLLLQATRLGVINLRVFCDDAVNVLRDRLPEASLSGLLIFFPDPWPKKRHHKRRLIRPEFVELAVSRLKLGGRIHLATDWEDYAQQMLEVMTAQRALRNIEGERQFMARPGYRPVTKFEARGHARGHRVWDLSFERVR